MMPHTVYLASLSTISFTFDTILSQDANFRLPDLGAFSIDSNTGYYFFINDRVITQVDRSVNNRNFSKYLFRITTYTVTFM